jgi:hypothetical protein
VRYPGGKQLSLTQLLRSNAALGQQHRRPSATTLDQQAPKRGSIMRGRAGLWSLALVLLMFLLIYTAYAVVAGFGRLVELERPLEFDIGGKFRLQVVGMCAFCLLISRGGRAHPRPSLQVFSWTPAPPISCSAHRVFRRALVSGPPRCLVRCIAGLARTPPPRLQFQPCCSA